MKQIKPPTIINLCVVRGICPANCIHCPVGQTDILERQKKFGLGFMELENFKRTCDEILEFNGEMPLLRIHGVGEPSLWNDLKEALIFAKKHKIRTWVFTMGLGKDDKTFIDTIKNADIVEFGINSDNPEDFSKTKRLGTNDFDKVVLRIRNLSRLKNGPRLLISRVQTKSKEEDDNFVLNWKKTKLANDVFIRSFHDYGQKIKDKDNLLIPKDCVKKINKECLVPNSRMNIDGVLGIVVRCFNELFDDPIKINKKSVGYILKSETLKEIWEGKTMQQWRERTFSYSLCANCKSCQPPNPNSSEKQLSFC